MFVRYAFLADNVTMDAGGKMNAMGIFDIILAQKFPTIQRDMTLVVDLEGSSHEKGEHKISIEMRDSKGSNKLFSFEQTISMTKPGITHGSLRAGLMTKMRDIPFNKAGQYEFVVFSDDRFLSRIVFTVNQLHIQKAGEA